MTLQNIIDQSSNIVFFGGAGVSTASGIPDFRSSNGLYNKDLDQNLSPETILSESFFRSNPLIFYDFYKNNLLYPEAKPNAAHVKLAELEAAGKLSCIITQNIDGLHQKAGSEAVLELHGNTRYAYCPRCGCRYTTEQIIEDDIPVCDCGEIIKPDIVLYEGSVKNMDVAARMISNANTLIIGGTSLSVWPAAGLIDYFSGTYLVLINRDSVDTDLDFDLVINEDIAEVFSKIKV